MHFACYEFGRRVFLCIFIITDIVIPKVIIVIIIIVKHVDLRYAGVVIIVIVAGSFYRVLLCSSLKETASFGCVLYHADVRLLRKCGLAFLQDDGPSITSLLSRGKQEVGFKGSTTGLGPTTI